MLYSNNPWSTWITGLSILLALILLSFFGGAFNIYLCSLALIFGIFALAYDLLYGYTGLVSFGHCVFFGIPAYAVGIFSRTVFHITNPLALFGLAIVSGVILGILIGFLCSFSRGIYMALITFAFAQIFELLVLSDPGGITYGENGIMGVRPPALKIGDFSLDLFNGKGIYFLSFVILVASYLIIRVLVNSHLGDVLKGIKQNEKRLLSLGYNTRPYKILAFSLSGVFSAIAGTLMAFLDNNITPSLVDWQVGAEILLITILGGPGTLMGPVVGAFLVVVTENYASSWIGGGNWVYVMGGLYICVVMFLPGGLFNNKSIQSALKRISFGNK